MRALVILASLVMFICPAGGKTIDAEKINGAQWDRSFNPKKGESLLLIKAQILLARAYFSPGEIDGRPGENLNKAIAAFAEAQGKTTDSLDQELWDALVAMSAEPVLTDYTISEADVSGPFVEKIPDKMEKMKELPHLGYTTPKKNSRKDSI